MPATTHSYQRDDCAPMYITIGDGGNIEGPYRNYVDGAPAGLACAFLQRHTLCMMTQGGWG